MRKKKDFKISLKCVSFQMDGERGGSRARPFTECTEVIWMESVLEVSISGSF